MARLSIWLSRCLGVQAAGCDRSKLAIEATSTIPGKGLFYKVIFCLLCVLNSLLKSFKPHLSPNERALVEGVFAKSRIKSRLSEHKSALVLIAITKNCKNRYNPQSHTPVKARM